MSSFFSPGACSDLAYENIRDLDGASHHRAFVEKLWQQFAGNEDKNFLSNARSQFYSRFWEMYLWCTFKAKGLSPTKVGSSGPEFYILIGDRRFWIEAICPEAGTTEDAVPAEQNDSEVRQVPRDKIILRHSGAICSKRQQWENHLRSGKVSREDGYIVAINSRRMPASAWFGSDLPFFVRACFPIGALAIPINTQTMEMESPRLEMKSEISRAKKTPIKTGLLEQDEYSFISAVLHSVACTNMHEKELGCDFDLALNRNAKVQLHESAFPWLTRWEFSSEALVRHLPNALP